MTLAKLSNHWIPSMPSIFDRFLDGELMDWSKTNYSGTDATLPAVNVVENEDAFLIKVAAPGMKKDDFQLHYDNGRLEISSEKQKEHKEKSADSSKMIRHEFCYQSFKRSFTVADHLVDVDQISANYEDGILNINLPKREEAKPQVPKQIAIG